MGKDNAAQPVPGTDEFNALSAEDQQTIIAAIEAQKAADAAQAIADAAIAAQQAADAAKASPQPSPEGEGVKASDVKYEVHFPQCNIPGMGFYTKEQLLADPDACAYLVEMGSPVVTIVSPDNNI